MTAGIGPIEEFFREIVRSELERVAGPRIGPKSAPPRVDSSGFLTIAASAKAASVSVGTVRNWLAKGKLRRYGHGRLVRVSHQELLGLLQQPQRGAPLSAVQRAAKIMGG